jgi:hypothetical protein
LIKVINRNRTVLNWNQISRFLSEIFYQGYTLFSIPQPSPGQRCPATPTPSLVFKVESTKYKLSFEIIQLEVFLGLFIIIACSFRQNKNLDTGTLKFTTGIQVRRNVLILG